MLLPLQQQRLPRTHLGARQIVLHQARGQGTLQALEELIDRCGEGVAATHGGRGVRGRSVLLPAGEGGRKRCCLAWV